MKIYCSVGRSCLMIVLFSVFSMLSACGKTGDLYLPNDSQNPQAESQQDMAEQKKQSKE